MDFKGGRAQTEDSTEINITPLIDVVFLLLIFFMVTATFSNQAQIEVNLPSTKTAQKKTSTTPPSSLTISANGKVFYNKTKIELSELSARIKEKIPAMLIVRADQKVSHGLVVKVMDLAKAAGVKKLAIASEQ